MNFRTRHGERPVAADHRPRRFRIVTSAATSRRAARTKPLGEDGTLYLLADSHQPFSTAGPPGQPQIAGQWAHTIGLWIAAHRLMTVAILLISAALWVVGTRTAYRWRHRHHADGARTVTISAPPEVHPAGAQALWANLAGLLTTTQHRRWLHGTPHLVVQYLWSGRRLQISLWVPGTVPPGAVEAAVRAAWPGAATTTDPNPASVLPAGAAAVAAGHIVPGHAEWLPFKTDHDADPLRALLAAGAQLRNDEHACVQILARPASRRRTIRARRAPARLRSGASSLPVSLAAPVTALIGVFLPGTAGTSRTAAATGRRDPVVERDVRLVVDKLSHRLWQTGIRYAVAKTTAGPTSPARVRGVADAIASSFAVYTGRNSLTHRLGMRSPGPVLTGRRLGRGFLTSTPELASLTGLPHDLAVPGLDRARAKSVPAPVAVPTGGRHTKSLGIAQAGGHPVALPVPDSRYHLHMVGSTGSGKTTLLTNMIIGDVLAGRGTVVIDPHGDLVLDVLDRLPAHVADRVVLFDPDQPNPPALNPLEGEDPDLVVDNIVSIFSSIFARAWGPRMDDVMRVSCLTLLRHANVTLQHIPPLLNSAQFRSEMTVGLDDPDGLAGFWQWYDEMNPAQRSQVIGPVLARLRAFLLRDFVRRTMRYPHSSFDMTDVLDGGVLLVRIPKGRLGEDTTQLLGSLILARVWQAATARANIPADRRRDAAIYLDECQNFLRLASSLDTMLAEARKYRLSMVLAHQDLAQFPRELLAAVHANARNKIYFTVSPGDARELGRHTLPELDEHDLSHLDAYTAVARLVVDGRQLPAFTMKTRPARPPVGDAAVIRQASAARVPAQDTSAVDDLVRRLSRPKDGSGRTARPPGTRP